MEAESTTETPVSTCGNIYSTRGADEAAGSENTTESLSQYSRLKFRPNTKRIVVRIYRRAYEPVFPYFLTILVSIHLFLGLPYDVFIIYVLYSMV
jgi:hypothetical protein